MILVRQACLSFGEQILFNNISCSFDVDQKIGVFGRNGSGKSTLLQAIAGHQKLDSGSIEVAKECTVAYMPQSMVLSSTQTVLQETLSIFKKELALIKRSKELESLLTQNRADADQLVQEYQDIQEQLAHFDQPANEKKAHEILNGLGFGDRIQQTVNTLSVGWKMRVVLAKLLLCDADFYLFDEPTNHLDLPAQEWFFSYLNDAPFGYLLVSHDRYFLDSACNYIFALEKGNGKLFTGNFKRYLSQKEKEDAITLNAYKQQQKDIAQKQKTIDRFRYTPSKAKMVQSMIKKLNAIERVEIEPVLPQLSFSFPALCKPGKIILTIKDLAHSFSNKPLFTNANSIIMRASKIALVAPNGTGKTTLFNLITNKLAVQKGSVEFGHNVEMAYFEQDQTNVLAPEKSILQEVSDHSPDIDESVIRAMLGSFLFSGDTVNKKIRMLSGGEKNRVAMVKVLLKKANFLILDEPTNHLDLQTKEILFQALQQYTGTIIIVSHDHDFINRLADTIIELNTNGLFTFPGNYEAYLEEMKSTKVNNHKQSQEQAPHQKTEKNSKEVKQLERIIDRLEKERDQLYCILYTHQYGSSDYNRIEKQVAKINEQLGQELQKWEALN